MLGPLVAAGSSAGCPADNAKKTVPSAPKQALCLGMKTRQTTAELIFCLDALQAAVGTPDAAVSELKQLDMELCEWLNLPRMIVALARRSSVKDWETSVWVVDSKSSTSHEKY